MEKALNEAAKVNKKDIVLLMDRIDFGWSNVDKRMITNRGINGIIQDYYAEKV